MESNGLSQVTPYRARIYQIITAACALIVAGYVLVLLLHPLDKADLIGYSICGRIPDHSFHIAGRQLPLCARCTGTYIGIAIGFTAVVLLRRGRAGEMLSAGMIMLMVAFIGVMGVDGLNSYLSMFDTLPHLYTPHNWLRAATGCLHGIALSMIVIPVFNYTLWKQTQPVRPLVKPWELPAILAVAAAAIVIVQTEHPWLLYPVALLTVAGVLGTLTVVNTMILLIVIHHDSQAEMWRDAAVPLLYGLTITLLELTAMGVLRYVLTGTVGWPLGQ
jgi:uncharacterized membrane protein